MTNFGRIMKNARNRSDDIIMYQKNPLHDFVEPVNRLGNIYFLRIFLKNIVLWLNENDYDMHSNHAHVNKRNVTVLKLYMLMS